MTAKKEVTIGLFGAGSVTQQYHLPVLRAMPGLRIDWVCDQEVGKARALARSCAAPGAFSDLEQCPDVDIALVAIPVGYRREPLRRMLERRWNLLCEKPFAMTLSDHDQILAQAAAMGVHVGAGLMRRYYQANLLAGKLVREGIFGEIEEVVASEGSRMRGTGRPEGWYLSSRAAGGGVLLETGSHVIDQVFNVLGARGFEILNAWQRQVHEVDFESQVNGTVSTSKQAKIPFALSLSYLNDLRSGISICFRSCSLKLGMSPEAPLVLCDRAGGELSRLQASTGANHVYQAFYLEWEDFIRQVNSGRHSAIDAATARLSTDFIEHAYRRCRAADLHPSLAEAIRS